MKKPTRILLMLLSFTMVTVLSAAAKPSPVSKVDKQTKEDKDKGKKPVSVPEPATMLLVGMGIGATMLGRVRGSFRRRDEKWP